MPSKKTKHQYLQLVGIIILVLALGRCVHDGLVGNDGRTASIMPDAKTGNATPTQTTANGDLTKQTPDSTASPNHKPHPIYSVSDYQKEFPDTNDLQLKAAQRWGVTPVASREDAEHRRKELVFVGYNPYYHVDPLQRSIPYLVPRAALLLQDIGQAFYDSLHIKGLPLHKPIVTSVLRSEEDIAKLRNYNKNATERSCHLYATTFDICYNRYVTVEPPDGSRRRRVGNDSLKWILSEVLRDKRSEGRCYVKYEVKQGCFHITVR